MFPKPFDYYNAGTVDEAVDLLVDHSDRETRVLSGGHSLLPMMKSGLAAPEVLIDIGSIDSLDRITVDADVVSIGGLTTYATIAASDEVQTHCPTVAEAAQAIGDIQVRNRGTIGGNVAHSDPASDLPAAVLASNASITTRGPDGERTISADDFFLGMYETAVEEHELLTEVVIPRGGEDSVAGYVKKPSPSSGYALVGVAAVLSLDGTAITAARVAANGAFDHATRLTAVEDTLLDRTIDSDLATDAAAHATDGFETGLFMDDLQTSSEFRARLLEVYTERALDTVFDRAEGIEAA